MNDFKVSIIIPAYNIETYVGKCLKSVSEQTYSNLEIIVVNDGSTDNTGRILDDLALKDKRIVVIHKENGGVSSARLCGINQATGDYIGFVDGDDYIEPEMYERLVKNAVKYDADISHCGYEMVFPKGRIDLYYGTNQTVIQDTRKGIIDLIKGEYIEPGICNKLYKKRLVEKVLEEKNLDLSIKINEDVLLNYYFFSFADKSVFEDFCPYHYIVRKGSTANSKTNKNHVEDPIKVTKTIINDNTDVKIGNILQQRLMRQYIGMIEVCSQKDELWMKEIKLSYINELKKLLSQCWKSNEISLKNKMMAFGIVYLEKIYYCIRKIYYLLTRRDQKYDLGL